MSEVREGPAPGFEVRSFRVVFRLERRLYKVQRWRIPVPHGIPVRGLGYGVGVLAVLLLISRVPVLGAAVAHVPAPVRFVIAPVLVAGALARLSVDGRPAHRHLSAWVRHRLNADEVSAFRPIGGVGSEHRFLDPVPVVPDASGAVYRRAHVRGPASLVVRYPARMRGRGRRLELTPSAGSALWRAGRVELRGGQVLVVRAAR